MNTSGTPPRRTLLKATALGTVAIAGVGGAVRLLSDGGDGDSDGAASLTLGPQQGLEALDVELGDDLLPSRGKGTWRSSKLPTGIHSMVAFTWAVDEPAPRIRIKSRTGGSWGEWLTMAPLEDGPDAGSSENSAVTGTDLVWIGDSDGIEVRVEGDRPRDLTLVLLRPDPDYVVGDLGRATDGDEVPTHVVPAPELLTRSDWGADESWRSGSPRFNRTVQQVHVHHTASTNTYERGDVPGLIRGMYRYHTHNLGWSDIAYNFLVDRFGRTWVGRYGGPGEPVRGAHTLGFNATSTGVSVIGNFDAAVPSAAVLKAVASLAAWKLDLYGHKPHNRTDVTSEGSDKFSTGRVVNLPVIDGHRDTNDTACPGNNLYAQLPTIRDQAAEIVHHYERADAAITVSRKPELRGRHALDGWLAVDVGTYGPSDVSVAVQWLRDGAAIAGARTVRYQCTAADVGHTLGVRVTLRRTGAEPVSRVLTTSGPVTAPVDVAVRTKGRKGRAIVFVDVTAPPGVDVPVAGDVTISINKRTKRLPLENGSAVWRAGHDQHFKTGTYAVAASYGGSSVFKAGSGSGQVAVK